MAENRSQALQSFALDFGNSKLSEVVKKAILKQGKVNDSYDRNEKSDVTNVRSDSLNVVDAFKMATSDVNNEITTDEATDVPPRLSSDWSHSASNRSDEKVKTLDSILDWSNEDDLLCKISVYKSDMNETSNNSDSDEKLLDFEFSTHLLEFNQKLMVNNDLSLFEKQKVPALQIGMAVPVPVLNVEETKFSKTVLRVLKNIQFHGPSCIQSVAWPAVERGRDMIVIAPPHSGKTVSYVLPLVSRFQNLEGATNVENKGPHSIILCSSWRKAYAVNEHFKLFLDKTKKKIFILYANGGHYKNKMQSLINSCDILIATPRCLLEFFHKKMISFARLQEFVVDDGSTIMEKHKKELKEIIICIMEAIRKIECSPQLILCSDRWSKNFQIIVDKVMRNPLLFFTSFLEAAIYAKIQITVHVCDSKHMKKVTVHDIIKDTAQKIVICTTDTYEAAEVHQFLNNLKCKSYLITEEMEHFVVDDVIKSWKAARNGGVCYCLVASDQIIADININDANCLIHFDIPEKSRLQFGNRFGMIAEHFISKESDSRCISHVLILESEFSYAASLVEIIENTGRTAPEKLIEISKMKQSDDNISGDLCYYMKAFGVCTENHCNNRHIIVPEIDKPQIVPYEGDIHGIITHIIDASHYYVRLLKYLDPLSNKTVSLIKTYAKLGFQLRDLYCHLPEEEKVENPVIGESYVIEEGNKLFYRVKILQYLPESDASIAQWKILYLDDGWVKYCKVPKFFKLKDNNLPKPLAVEVYACNIAPPDSSFDWNPQTSLLTSDLLKGKEIHGKIVLCIGETLWLDPLAVAVKLSDGCYVYPFKIDQKLLDYGHIIKRKNHLESLYRVCNGKIPLPQITKPKVKEEKFEENMPTISYAFLECEVYENVYVSCIVSPDQLYIQRAKFVDCLDELLDKINAQVEKRKLKKAYSVFKNMVCIAPFFEDNRYYRATVTDILSEEEVSVFFVDFGDYGTVVRKDIFSISAEFLLLPFQAIECELTGIKAPHGGWTESAANALTRWTRDESCDMKIVNLKAYQKLHSYTSGNRYVIDLWDDDNKLSDLLLQSGFCVPVEAATQVSSINASITSDGSDFNLNECYSPSSEDQGLDPEEKAINARFYEAVEKIFTEYCDLLPKMSSTEDSDEEEEILEKYNTASLPFSDEKEENIKKKIPKIDQLKKILPSREPLHSVKPLITWWDIPVELNVLINLKDIKMFELEIKNESLSFCTVIAGVQYETRENFYDKIDSSSAKIDNTLRGVKITVKKVTPFKWPRLTREKNKFFHIKYDLVHIEDSDTEENSKPDTNTAPDMRYAYDEKENSTTDEDETYVAPWKEFAKYKDPVTDLLSEI